MNSQERKKQRERFWLEMLRSRLPEIQSARVEGRERPDFILTTDHRSIGLEVAEYCHPELERQDRLAERVRARAEAEYASLGLPPVWVQAELAVSAARAGHATDVRWTEAAR